MKTYHLRVTRTQVKYCSVTAKSLDLPDEPMVIESYNEFTGKEKNDAKKKERNTETRESFQFHKQGYRLS